jgi:hypothetical protein
MTMIEQIQGKEIHYINHRRGAARAASIWGSPHIGHPHLPAATETNYHPGVGQSR